jgi:preprotein translocase subunit SecE
MAMIGRKEPATQPAHRKETRQAAGASSEKPSRLNKLRENINNIRAELAKVTWPTREETRNLTIVVIGISAVLGAALGLLDVILSAIYQSFR